MLLEGRGGGRGCLKKGKDVVLSKGRKEEELVMVCRRERKRKACIVRTIVVECVCRAKGREYIACGQGEGGKKTGSEEEYYVLWSGKYRLLFGGSSGTRVRRSQYFCRVFFCLMDVLFSLLFCQSLFLYGCRSVCVVLLGCSAFCLSVILSLLICRPPLSLSFC